MGKVFHNMSDNSFTDENGNLIKIMRNALYPGEIIMIRTIPFLRIVAGIGIALCIIFTGKINGAHARDDSFEYGSIAKFGGGIISGFLIHEGAHVAVARLTGTSMEWRRGDINQPITFEEHSASDNKGLAINAAGLLVQTGSGEFILRYDKIDKNDSYVRGIMFWNVVNPLLYTIDYWFIHNTNKSENGTYAGDISGVEHYANKRTADVFAATMAAVAVFQGYRYVKTQSWAPDWLKGKPSENISLMPLPSGGALLSYTISY